MCTEPHTSDQTDDNWAPEACALPTAEQPLRFAEFDQLFSTALPGVERRAPTQLRLLLARGNRIGGVVGVIGIG